MVNPAEHTLGEHRTTDAVQLLYFNDVTGWYLTLAKGAAEGASYTTTGSKNTEWLIIDKEKHDRFGHEGATVICGAGTKWSFLHRETPFGKGSTDEEDNEDELP